jgi:hypothetical protein
VGLRKPRQSPKGAAVMFKRKAWFTGITAVFILTLTGLNTVSAGIPSWFWNALVDHGNQSNARFDAVEAENNAQQAQIDSQQAQIESLEGVFQQPLGTIIDGNGNVLPIVSLSFHDAPGGSYGNGGAIRGGYVFDSETLLPITITIGSANLGPVLIGWNSNNFGYFTTNCTGQTYMRHPGVHFEFLNRSISLTRQDQTSFYEGDRTSIAELTMLSYSSSDISGCHEVSNPSPSLWMPANVVGIFPYIPPYAFLPWHRG